MSVGDVAGLIAAIAFVLLVGLLALSNWTAAEILQTYRLTEPELVQILARLDSIGVIDLLPGNRIKLKLARNFAWRKGGPLQRFFEARVQRQFFESSFLGSGELRLMVHASLSPHSNALLQQRMKKIAEEFDALVSSELSRSCLASPKSRIFAWPRAVMNKFAGLMSRWTMPLA